MDFEIFQRNVHNLQRIKRVTKYYITSEEKTCKKPSESFIYNENHNFRSTKCASSSRNETETV